MNQPSFKICYLINPRYLYYRIVNVGSWAELTKKIKDVFILGFKIATLRYGEKYWRTERMNTCNSYSKNPNKLYSFEEHMKVGRMFAELQAQENALKAFGSALNIDPHASIAYVERARVYLENNEYASAIAQLQKAIEISPDDIPMRLLLSKAYQEMGSYTEGLSVLRDSALLCQEDRNLRAEIKMAKAQIYFMQNRHDLVVEELCSITHNISVQMLVLLGKAYKEVGQYEKALQSFKRAVALSKHGETGGIYCEMAQVHFAKKEYSPAIKNIEKAIVIDPSNIDYYIFLGKTCTRNGNYELGLEAFHKALQLNHKNCTRENEGEIQGEIEKLYCNKEQVAITQARTQGHDHTRNTSPVHASRKYADNKEYDKALSILNEALGHAQATKTLRSDMLIEKSKIYLAIGNKEKLSIESAKAAIQLIPSNPIAYVMLGKAYRQNEQYTNSLEAFENGLRLCEGQKHIKVEIYHERAELYRENKQFDLAMQDYLHIENSQKQNSSSINAYAQREPDTLSFPHVKEMVDKIARTKRDIDTYNEKGIIASLEKYNRQGDFKKVISEANRTINLVPETYPMVRNAIENEREIALHKTTLSSKVRSLVVSLTNACNLDCIMCSRERHAKKELSQKSINELIALFPFLESITWIGGEVFLFGGFKDILKESLKYPFKQQITTNALLITEEIARMLIVSNVGLTCSVDAVTKETYEKIRRGARYEAFIENIKMINRIKREINPDFKMGINTVVMRANCHEVERIADFAHEYGFSTVYFNIVSNSKNKTEDIFIENYDSQLVETVIRATRNARAKCISHAIEFGTTINEDLAKKTLKKEKSHHENNQQNRGTTELPLKTLYCFAPWKKLSINHCGDVTPLSTCLCDNIIGNLNIESMDHLWNNEMMIAYRESILRGDLAKVCTLKSVYRHIPVDLLKC